jgi:hypothetical protein
MKINVKNQKVVSKCIIKVVIIMNVGFAACIISSIASLIIGAVVFRKNQDKFIYYV